MPRVFIGVGSNLGDRQQQLNQAQFFTTQIPGVHFIRSSSVFETDPVGGPRGQEKYFNSVWEIQTTLNPEQLLDELMAIERQMGRIRLEKNGPRTIDLDILTYGDQVLERQDLNIPHPRLHEREFVLEPFSELAPDLRHPKLNKNIRSLLKEFRENHPRS